MSGLYLFAVVGLLGYLAWKLSALAVRRIPNPWLGKGCQVLLTVLLMSLLVVDEIIGGFQFRKLCEQNAVLRIDPEKARGKLVKFVNDPLNEPMPTTPVKIYHSRSMYLEVKTNELVADYDWYTIEGGWLIHLLGISEKNHPLTIGDSSCSPPYSGTLALQYEFTVIN